MKHNSQTKRALRLLRCWYISISWIWNWGRGESVIQVNPPLTWDEKSLWYHWAIQIYSCRKRGQQWRRRRRRRNVPAFSTRQDHDSWSRREDHCIALHSSLFPPFCLVFKIGLWSWAISLLYKQNYLLLFFFKTEFLFLFCRVSSEQPQRLSSSRIWSTFKRKIVFFGSPCY